ncbi:MAG: LytR C-terminal domain-containing protein [Acidimicrobiia bacterium]
MTVLPTERVVPEAPASATQAAPEQQVAPDLSEHPRLDRRRQRRRRRVEGVLIIVALPVAVLVTLLMLLTASGGTVLPAQEAAASPAVRVEGALPAPVSEDLNAAGFVIEAAPAPNVAYERTEVVYFAAGDRAQAEAVADALGGVAVVLGAHRPEGATLVIRVGQDLRR